MSDHDSDSARLTQLSVRELTERLASRAPVPGGGSAAALAAALGAALVHMVVELSIGREELAPHEQELQEIGLAAANWQSELLNLAELDASAYDAVVRARRLPRDTGDERDLRRMQIAAATREATHTPLHIAEAASNVLDLAARVAPIGNRNAASDAGVAAHLASAALHGAALNVRINLPYLEDDDELRSDAEKGLARLLDDARAREDEALSAVDERMPRGRAG